MTKLGYFVLDPQPGMVERIINTRPAVVKSYAQHGFIRQLINAGLDPRTKIVERAWWETDDLGHLRSLTSDDPKQAAYYYLMGKPDAGADLVRRGVISQMRELPGVQGSHEVYWESMNEMSNWDMMDWYGQFEAERTRILANEGFRACVGNFATGCPPLPTDSQYWCLEAFAPAILASIDWGGVYGKHEYASMGLSLWGWGNQHGEVVDHHNWNVFPGSYGDGEWYLVCRYRTDIDYYEKMGITGTRVVLTEFGWDRAGVYTTDMLNGGKNSGPVQQVIAQGLWKQWPFLIGDKDQYAYAVEQLAWADDQFMRDEYMVGATIFCYGSNDPVWKEWDINGGIMNHLEPYMQSFPPSDLFKVNAPEGLRVYFGAFGRFWVKGVLPHASTVEVMSYDGEWARIRSGPTEGWVKKQYLIPI